MENLHEILKRDSRTTISLAQQIKEIQSSDCSETCEHCDKLDKSRRQNYFIKSQKSATSKFSTKLLNYLIVVISIAFISSISLIEAIPIRIKKNSHPPVCEGFLTRGTRREMTNQEKKEKIHDIFTSCDIAIQESNSLIAAYVDADFNEKVDAHHARWEHTKKPILSWLYPESKLYSETRMLKKKYNGDIESDHLKYLKESEWDDEMIINHLEDIYIRLNVIKDGLNFIKGWIEANESDVNNSTQKVFSSASTNIEDLICQIVSFFHQIKREEVTSVMNDSILPPHQKDEDFKLERWFVYREYEHVIKYAKELILIIKANL